MMPETTMSPTPPRDSFSPAMPAGAFAGADEPDVGPASIETPSASATRAEATPGTTTPGTTAPATTTLRGPLDSEVAEELVAVAAAQDCELLLAEYRGGVLRLVLDREEGVTHTHCERVSRQASAVLDVLDFGRGKYVLEVSSPGLDRELYAPRDYLRFAGHLARVTFRDPADGNKKTVIGRLAPLDTPAELETSEEHDWQLQLTEELQPVPGAKKPGKATLPTPGKTYTFPLSAVQLARLEVEL